VGEGDVSLEEAEAVVVAERTVKHGEMHCRMTAEDDVG
jgi:hypothetical protein